MAYRMRSWRPDASVSWRRACVGTNRPERTDAGNSALRGDPPLFEAKSVTAQISRVRLTCCGIDLLVMSVVRCLPPRRGLICIPALRSARMTVLGLTPSRWPKAAKDAPAMYRRAAPARA